MLDPNKKWMTLMSLAQKAEGFRLGGNSFKMMVTQPIARDARCINKDFIKGRNNLVTQRLADLVSIKPCAKLWVNLNLMKNDDSKSRPSL